MEEHENFNIKLQRSRSITVTVLGHQCLMGWLLLRSVTKKWSPPNRTSGPVICSYMTGWGSQSRESDETIVDRSTDLTSGCFSFSSTWCRSLLLSFSTCYLGILGLEGAKKLHIARGSTVYNSQFSTMGSMRACHAHTGNGQGLEFLASIAE